VGFHGTRYEGIIGAAPSPVAGGQGGYDSRVDAADESHDDILGVILWNGIPWYSARPIICRKCTPMATIKKSPLFLLGALAIFLLPAVSCSCPSTPSVSSLSPSSATAGGSGFVLTVDGNSFASNAVVVWNGTSLTTSFLSNKQLTATIPGTDIAQPDTAVVYVYNPASANQTVATGTVEATNSNQCGASGSNATSFTISP